MARTPRGRQAGFESGPARGAVVALSREAAAPEAGPEADAAGLARLAASGLFDEAFYLACNPSLEGGDGRALEHYHARGWREGRKPNFYFEPNWYLAANEDVREAGIDPLLHYADRGEAEGRRPCAVFDPVWYRQAHEVPGGMLALAHLLAHRRSGAARAIPEFDADWYLRTYGDIADARIDPLEHYLVQGFREARVPFEGFDPTFYRQRYLRGMPEANPLLHFARHRDEPGVHPALPPGETTIAREVRRHAAPHPTLFEHRDPVPSSAPRRARVLAYYLPQFHPVPENDAWWGEGFTEWTNLARALPRFAGHYQPRTPRDLGHYRLDREGAAETLRRQIELARGAALSGFVFYFYWFNGRRLLDGPLEALLADRSLDFPFCLMWANENWTRRWDGSDDEILIGQDYRGDDEAALLACFARHFADPRYIRVGGRPLLMIYRPRLIPDTEATVARWRARLRDVHGEEPLILMSQSFGDHDPRPLGLDGAVEFPPHKLCDALPAINQTLDLLDTDFSARVYEYGAVARASLAEPAPPYRLVKTAVPSWDNDARRQGAGLVLHGATPAAYQDWLEALVLGAAERPFHGEPIVCVNAWNEWAEGATLEPDLHYGHAFLNATGRAITGCARVARLLLVGHDALAHGAQMLLLRLAERLVGRHGVAVSVLLLARGPLEAAFARLGPVTVMAADAPELGATLARLRLEGVTAALVNSLASGALVPRLAALGIPSVLLAHEMPGLLREKGLEATAAAALAGAEEVVVAAPEIASTLAACLDVDTGRALVIPQGIYRAYRFSRPRREAFRARLGLGPADLLVVGLGYADLRKGFDLFLQLWRSLGGGRRDHAPARGGRARAGAPREAGRRVHCLWAGRIDPTLRHYLSAEIDAATATGSFHLPGFLEDPSDLFAAADCHALTSREDPFPSVVLEAMAAGLPTVAFDNTGGIPALIRAAAAGAVVARGDIAAFAAEALAAAAAHCGEADPRARDRLARIARRDFDFGAYAHRLLHLARPGMLDVSVGVPSYNYARYMEERLASVFRQSHPVREVIVLDDASTDGSAAAARAAAAAAGRTVEVIERPSNGGSAFAAWRELARTATGAWIWIAEADDAADPTFLAALADRLRGVPDAVLAFTDSRSVDAEGGAVGASYQEYYRAAGCPTLARDGVHAGPDFVRDCLSERNLILNASGVLFRRAALLAALARCGDELAGLRVAGDWRVYVEMLREPSSRVVYVARPLNVHRRHDDSVTHRLAARRHLVEVERVHAAIATFSSVGASEQARQRAYRAGLRAQFGLGEAEPEAVEAVPVVEAVPARGRSAS